MSAEGQTAVPPSRGLSDDLTECCWSCFFIGTDDRDVSWLMARGSATQSCEGGRGER